MTARPYTIPGPRRGAFWGIATTSPRVRRCGTCKQHVFHLSVMTRAEAEAVIAEHDARMCIQYFHRADDTILLRDCAVEYRPTGMLVVARRGGARARHPP